MPNELLMRPLRFDDLNKEQGWYQISLVRQAQNIQPPPSICMASPAIAHWKAVTGTT
jgi:hypothetical protein